MAKLHGCAPYRHRKGRDIAALIALSLSLGACTLTAVDASRPIATRTLSESFTLEGRLAATDGVRNANGPVVWVHTPHGDEWTAFSPLGQIVARLTSTTEGAILETAEGDRRSAPSAQDVLPELFGTGTPVDGLTYWVQAVPRDGARVLQRDALGRPTRISDAGWIIDYAVYTDDTPGSAPRRLEAHWGETRIRLVIDQWTDQP